MGLINNTIEILLTPKTISYLENLGYEIPKWVDKRGRLKVKTGTKISIKVCDLPKYSKVRINVVCDECNIKMNPTWQDYIKCVKEDGKYYCNKCAIKLYSSKNSVRTKLKNGKSFEQWCKDNNRQDVLDRWDYKLNNLLPSEIGFGKGKRYYFKCSRGIHKSELKSINDFTSGHNGVMDCKACNSFAQWGIDNICEDFLEKYWDHDKNENINPWIIAKRSMKKVNIKCQIDYSHNSYSVTCANFTFNNTRCPECKESKGERKISKYLSSLSIRYETQKEFNGLIGLKGGNLSYDFYIFDYNLLIEYQGEMHGSFIEGVHKSKKDFEKQQEHDRRKREYAKLNNYNLLEIWYWDYDNIEEILREYIKIRRVI